jgi:hypothetical protein
MLGAGAGFILKVFGHGVFGGGPHSHMLHCSATRAGPRGPTTPSRSEPPMTAHSVASPSTPADQPANAGHDAFRPNAVPGTTAAGPHDDADLETPEAVGRNVSGWSAGG